VGTDFSALLDDRNRYIIELPALVNKLSKAQCPGKRCRPRTNEQNINI